MYQKSENLLHSAEVVTQHDLRNQFFTQVPTHI